MLTDLTVCYTQQKSVIRLSCYQLLLQQHQPSLHLLLLAEPQKPHAAVAAVSSLKTSGSDLPRVLCVAILLHETVAAVGFVLLTPYMVD